ncbi:Pentatricopeptide repeat-containing protein, mitochondrial [Vitis vinifera]|uniref:Pentatricopeptide repeat-containing protein, mitochondrial n=1 Tax=Vitis vinifera TaxID=29760 RepID=A0A438IX45_VITVI|nr:Pentatricopeptide repeat-containing protein, mitochondrial [Vitis vinifera]
MKELGCEPNVVTYDTIIKLLCEHGRIREAYGVLDQMREKDCAPNVMTYHCFFGCLEKPKQIFRMFDRMINSVGGLGRMDTYVMLMKKFGSLFSLSARRNKDFCMIAPVVLTNGSEKNLSPDSWYWYCSSTGRSSQQ